MLSRRHPVHVVQRVSPEVGQLRRRDAYRAIRHALQHVLGRADFRVVHVSIQRTHLHLIVEADDRFALGRGMQALLITAARALNRACHRPRGTVFAQRYHATQVASPRQARAAIAYVLNNWRKHREDQGDAAAIDRYASGIGFQGWRMAERFVVRVGYEPLPVASAETWLLREGWKRHGLIGLNEVPG
jgi:putative transposase